MSVSKIMIDNFRRKFNLKTISTFLHNPYEVLKEANLKLFVSDPEWGKEDYRVLWNHTSFVNKAVLDLGADHGSTAAFFLSRGARRVIAVEGRDQLFILLLKNFGKNAKVYCVFQLINNSRQIDDLLQRFKPDIVKADIEGYEELFVHCNRNLLTSVPVWLIEIHSDELTRIILERFNELGYISKQVVPRIKNPIWLFEKRHD
jgi:16S rRNA G966 N2-methylase RsmD